MDVKHVLVWFSKEDDSFLGEHSLDEISFENLKAIVKPYEDDPFMYYSYPVSRRIAALLKKELNIPIDIFQFDYFVEAVGQIHEV